MKAPNTKKNPPSLLGGSKTCRVFKTEATSGNHHRSQKQQLATPLKPLVTPLKPLVTPLKPPVTPLRDHGNVTT